MALPELFANTPTPGVASAITTLSGNGGSITAIATSFTVASVAPTTLQGSGQFRILVDQEYMLVTSGANTTTWTVTRGVDGSTAATHSDGASIYHVITAGALSVAFLKPTNNLSDVSDTGASRYNLKIPTLRPAAAVATTNVSSLSGSQTIDGYTLSTTNPDYVLLTAQTTASQNGLWQVNSGAWTRPTDFFTGASVGARTCTVVNGTANGKSTWLLQTSAAITVDTNSQTWVQVAKASVNLVQANGATQPYESILDIESDGSLSISASDDSTNGRTQIFISASALQTQANANTTSLQTTVLGVSRFVSGAWQARPNCVICMWIGPSQPPSGTGQQLNDLYVTGS